jgi:hypothetical protein
VIIDGVQLPALPLLSDCAGGDPHSSTAAICSRAQLLLLLLRCCKKNPDCLL